MFDITLQCILYTIPLLLHLGSIVILYLTKHSSKLQHNQRLYLINLSVAEATICFFGIVKRLWKHYNHISVFQCVHIFQSGIGTFVHYSIMTALTFDRFFEIFLNIKYHLYCSKRRTHGIIYAIWFLAILFTAFLYVVEKVDWIGLDVKQILLYFYPLFSFTCVIVGLSTYLYIFIKMFMSKQSYLENISRASFDISRSSFQRTRKALKQGYLLGLLMASFTFFIMIPESIYFYYGLNKLPISHTLKTVLTTFYFCAYTADVFIYLFASEAFRKTLFWKLGIMKWKKPHLKEMSSITTDISKQHDHLL